MRQEAARQTPTPTERSWPDESYYFLSRAKSDLFISLVVAVMHVGETVLMSGASFLNSTYSILWDRSISRSEYLLEVWQAFMAVFGILRAARELLIAARKTINRSGSAVAVLVWYRVDKCVHFFHRQPGNSSLPVLFEHRKRLYKGIGRLILAFLLCITPLQVVGMWMLLRFFSSALLSRWVTKLVPMAGSLPAVDGSEIQSSMLKALITGCCRKSRPDPLLMGVLYFISTRCGVLPIYYILLSMGVTLLCMGVIAFYALKKSGPPQSSCPQNMDVVLREPNTLQFVNLALLITVSICKCS
jgi:hypothetical protein